MKVCIFVEIVFFLVLAIGAVFNLLCSDRDRKIMEEIERYFQHQIPEAS